MLFRNKISTIYTSMKKIQRDKEVKWSVAQMLFRNYFSKMYISLTKKMQRDKEVEKSVAQALFELKNTHRDLKNKLKDMHFNSANQIDVSGNRKAVVILFPYRFRERFRKIHAKLVSELEKKWSGKDVVFVATKMIDRPQKKSSFVHAQEALLEDIVHPAKIVMMRRNPRPHLVITILLDTKARNDPEYKLETFRRVYQKLWGGNIYFKYYNMKKIRKNKRYKGLTEIEEKMCTLTEIEESVAQALFDLEDTHEELKNDLKDLYIKTAYEINVSGNRTAVAIEVPCRFREPFRKIHAKLVSELEKKWRGKDVVIYATRNKGYADLRAVLEDIVYPTEIVGRGDRHRIFLDPKDRNDTEYKLETFCKVYMELFQEEVFFEYRDTQP